MSYFRFDVNGLRAWAVGAVILYHFGVLHVSGGFAGVDIFFVISGFLMTGILVRNLELDIRGRVLALIWNFYMARAKRIVPALLVLCFCLLIFGWFFLAAADYDELGKQVIGAVTFLSNLKFWRETGYFSPNVHEIWLLHTWSLSVEWQFYLILPLVLLTAWQIRPGRSTIKVILIGGFFASLGLSLWLMHSRASTAFFLLPPRSWEMIFGGLIFMYKADVTIEKKKLLNIAGMVLIILSIFLFTADDAWPGWRVLIPTTGTALVLYADYQNSIWTNNRVAQWMGDRSYSLYLWHWPIFVCLTFLEKAENPYALVFGLLLTMVMGEASYRFIEVGTKTYFQQVQQRRIFLTLIIAAFTVFIPGMAVSMAGGVTSRMSDNINVMFTGSRDRSPWANKCLVGDSTPVPGCTYGGPDLGAIVIGDSHAGAIMQAVEKALPSTNLHVLDWSMTRCPTMSGIKDKHDSAYRCSEFVGWALQQAKKLPPDVPLIIMNRVSLYAYGVNTPLESLTNNDPYFYFTKQYSERGPALLAEIKKKMVETACSFAKDRKVYMVRPTPELVYDVPKTMGRAMVFGVQRDVSISLAEYKLREKFAWDAQDAAHAMCGIIILDPIPFLCENGKCDGVRNGRPLYYDDSHLSQFGANQLVPMFETIFTKKM